MQGKFNKKAIIILAIVLVIVFAIIASGGKMTDKKTSVASTNNPTQGVNDYPSAMTETMSRDALLSCNGGNQVNLWRYPTSDMKDNYARAKVSCGPVRVFNKYFNKKDNLTFYALETNDNNGKLTYGWVTDDFITFK